MKATRAVEIKGSALPVLRVVVREGDPQSLSEEIERAVSNARPLLAEAVAVLDLRERAADENPSAILEAVRNAGSELAAVLTAEAGMREQLADSGLPIIESPMTSNERPSRELTEEPAPSKPRVEVQETAPDPSPELMRAACSLVPCDRASASMPRVAMWWCCRRPAAARN